MVALYVAVSPPLTLTLSLLYDKAQTVLQLYTLNTDMSGHNNGNTYTT